LTVVVSNCSTNVVLLFVLTVGGDFSSKLDEVSEYYMTKGVCHGEECSQLRVQVRSKVKLHRSYLHTYIYILYTINVHDRLYN